MTPEAEIGVILPQAKECQDWWQPAEAGRRYGTHAPSEPLRKNSPYLHFDFRLLGSRTVSEPIPVILSHENCGNLLQQL